MPFAIPTATVVTVLIRDEIDRFIQAAKVRSEYDIDTRRRSMRRYHRSWPLLVCDDAGTRETSAALHSASSEGIGFVCREGFDLGQVLLIKLFWHDQQALRVPAVVKHVSPQGDAVLVGCQFAVDNESACAAGFRARNWHEI